MEKLLATFSDFGSPNHIQGANMQWMNDADWRNASCITGQKNTRFVDGGGLNPTDFSVGNMRCFLKCRKRGTSGRPVVRRMVSFPNGVERSSAAGFRVFNLYKLTRQHNCARIAPKLNRSESFDRVWE